MHPQLQVIIAEFDSAQVRLHSLAHRVPEQDWHLRADPSRWSMAECLGHLNLTAEAYLPLLKGALELGRRSSGPAPRRYRRDPIGWLMWRMVGPPVRHRVKTTAAFVPRAEVPLSQLMADFDRLQRDQVSCVGSAEGLDLGRLWIRSPFDSRIRYNLYACLTILPRHQHRHLWQAEQVLSMLNSPTHRKVPGLT